MRSNRLIINLSYFFLVLWWFVYWACKNYFIIFYPPIFFFIFGSFILFFCFSFLLFMRSTKWFSEARIVACLLLIPIIWFFTGDLLVEQAKLRIIPPNQAAVQAFIHRGAGTGVEKANIDMSKPFVFYHRSSRHLEVHIHFQSDHFIYWFFHKDPVYENLAPPAPESLVKYLRMYFVFPEQMSSVTLIPKQITLYGYWNDTLVVKNQFTLSDGNYKMVPPDQPLNVIVQDGNWYLEYTINSSSHRIFITYEKSSPNFKRNSWKPLD